MAELASAYITLIPSLKGAQATISKQLGGVDTGGIGQKLGTKASSGFSGGFAKMGAVAGVVGAVTSKALGAISASMDGAIKRTDMMNNFPKVMSNMGISAESSQAAISKMSDKLTGLPTSLDSAAAGVQRLTSKNNDVGKSTDMFLALNNAMLAGGASTEIQSSAMEQLTQAYSKGKMDMMEWRSLQTAMPAQLNQVAQAMGMTSDELGEGLRNGSISMDEFMDKIVELNTEGVDGFASFEEQAKSAVGGIGTQIENVKTAISRSIANVLNAIGTENIAKAFSGFTNVIKIVGDVVVELVNKIKDSGLGEAFGRLFESAKTALEPIVNTIGPAFMSFFDGLVGVVTNVVNFIADLFDMVAESGVGETISNAFSKIAETVGPLVSMIGNTLGPILKTVFGVIINGINVVLPILSQVVAWIIQLVTWIGNILGPVIVALYDIWASIWNAIFSVVQTLWTALTEGFTTVVSAISNAFTNAGATIQGVWNSIVGFFQWLWGVISAGFETLISGISNFFSSAVSTIQSIWSGIVGFFSGVWNSLSTGASNAVNSVIGFIGGLPGQIKSFFSNADSWLIDAGRNIIEGLKNGIVNAFEDVKNFVSGIGTWIADNKGPKAYDLALLIPNGTWIMESLSKGLQKGLPAVKSTLSDITDEIAATRFDSEITVATKSQTSLLRGKTALLNADQLAKHEEQRPIVVHAIVESILDSRKVGYGTASYVSEKNRFDENRKKRIGGTLTNGQY